MLTILNRRKLLSDTSAEELARVREILKREGIPYTEKTIRPRGVVGRSLDAATTSRYWVSYRWAGGDLTPFIYTLYVRRKDYERAKACCW